MINRETLARAFEVNDALVQERRNDDDTYTDATLSDLDIDIQELTQFAAEYAIPRAETTKDDPAAALILSFTMGAITALRARKLSD